MFPRQVPHIRQIAPWNRSCGGELGDSTLHRPGSGPERGTWGLARGAWEAGRKHVVFFDLYKASRCAHTWI